MSLAALRDTIDVLTESPVLWVPGLVCGMLAAILWLVLVQSGTFFASRLLVIFSLLALLFIAGMLAAIKKNSNTLRGMLADGVLYYFKVLVPTLVIVFSIVIIFILVVLTLGLVGMNLEEGAGLFTFLLFGVVLPTVVLTFFYDTAVVFDEKKVFESLGRSIDVVTAHLGEVLLFFTSCLLILGSISFAFMVIWTALLSERLEPISQFNQTQIQLFSPEQLVLIIGSDGVVITALFIFCLITILVPVLYTYKACFYHLITEGTAPVQQKIGEYDSKGRWYKY
jgi:hypothetical protein